MADFSGTVSVQLFSNNSSKQKNKENQSSFAVVMVSVLLLAYFMKVLKFNISADGNKNACFFSHLSRPFHFSLLSRVKIYSECNSTNIWYKLIKTRYNTVKYKRDYILK